VSAPFDLRPLYAQFDSTEPLAEAYQLAQAQRRLSRFAARAQRIMLPGLSGVASVLACICLIAQIAVRIRLAA
jgi:hypothetical protein